MHEYFTNKAFTYANTHFQWKYQEQQQQQQRWSQIATTAVAIDFHFMLVTVLRIIEHLYPISEDLSLDEAASTEMKDGPKMKTKTPIEIQSGSIIFEYIHCAK